MIPTSRRYRAIFVRTDSMGMKYEDFRSVEAWSDTGEALIASRSGVLVPAREEPGFALVELDPDDRALAAVPGGGWHFAWAQKDGAEFLDPVIAWVIDANGAARPLCVDVDDLTAEPVVREESPTAQLRPPGGAYANAPTNATNAPASSQVSGTNE